MADDGKIQYTLGADAGGLMSALGSSLGRLSALAAGFVSLGAVAAGVWRAIESGSLLTDLSARTGESVRDLYLLQQAYTVVGNSAEAVTTDLFKLQQVLGEAGAGGKAQSEDLRRLGLSLQQLQGMTGLERIQAVVESLSKMDRTQAASVASGLFGRFGAGNIMTLVGDAQAFRDTLREAAAEATLVAQNAAAFDQLGDTFGRLKAQAGSVFTGIAAGVVPALQQMVDLARRIDFVGIGTGLGQAIGTALNVIREGKLGEVISLTIQAGFEQGINRASALLQAFFAAVPTLLSAGGNMLGALGNSTTGYLTAGFASYAQSRLDEARTKGEPTAYWEQQVAQFSGLSADSFAKSKESAGKMVEKFQQAMVEALQASTTQILPGEASAALANLWQSLVPKAGTVSAGRRGAAAGMEAGTGGSSASGYTPERTSWEKIGAIIGGSGSGGSGPAYQTMRNTETMIDVMRQQLAAAQETIKALRKGGAGVNAA